MYNPSLFVNLEHFHNSQGQLRCCYDRYCWKDAGQRAADEKLVKTRHFELAGSCAVRWYVDKNVIFYLLGIYFFVLRLNYLFYNLQNLFLKLILNSLLKCYLVMSIIIITCL